MVRELRPGNLIGRLSTATLRVQDPRVSEAHALVVLRGRALRLLALRGSLLLDGAVEDEITLATGQRIGLADDLVLEVGDVVVPARVLALTIDDGPAFEPCAPVHALIMRSEEPEWVPGYRADALAHVHASDTGWVLQEGDRTIRLTGPQELRVGGHVVRVVWADAPDGTEKTSFARGRERLVISVRADTASIVPGGREPCHVNGRMAEVLSELAALGSPVDWDVVASQIWRDAAPERRRKSFDNTLVRLRSALREHGIREDIVRSNGKGVFELYLNPGDQVVDDTGAVLGGTW